MELFDDAFEGRTPASDEDQSLRDVQLYAAYAKNNYYGYRLRQAIENGQFSEASDRVDYRSIDNGTIRLNLQNALENISRNKPKP